MKRTGQFTIHSFSPQFKRGEKVALVPFGDVHRSTKSCCEEKWLDTLHGLEKRLALGENIYLLGMGDYDDFLSAGERVNIQRCDLHETTEEKIDEVLDRHVDILVKELSAFKGRFVGLLEGNHYGRYFHSGVTTTQKMCEKLECAYLGGSSFIRLSFTIPPAKRMCVDIFAHHGKGGGSTGGSSVNNVERMAQVAEADIYLMAHDHQRWAFKSSRLKLVSGTKLDIQDRELIFARTGSFLKAYEPNTHCYVSEKCLRPSDIGNVEISLLPRVIHKRENGKESYKNIVKMEVLV